MNKSYVFFRETDLDEHDEAIGAQGISLTAARSIAVDRKMHTYGMPVFVNALLPIRAKARHHVSAADDRAGHRRCHHRSGARRYLSWCGRRAGATPGGFKHPGSS